MEVNRDGHGHHDHESYYGDCDMDKLVKFCGIGYHFYHAIEMTQIFIFLQMMKDLISLIKLESHMNTLDNSSTKLATGLKRPAPVIGGCRIEGFVRVKKVLGNLVISVRSAAYSFDASQMNISHVISSFSFCPTLYTASVTRINSHETTHFFDVHKNSMSGKEHESSKETPCLMASVYGIESSVECNAGTSCNPKGKISLIGVRRQKNESCYSIDAVALSTKGDIDVLGPPILNPERLGMDDVKGTDEELL
ncbi:hypothetical protein FXO38_17653 [Capsicum annuum]|nr:hypothetical protein FXO38_17653 [Capsicum annuum]KAF3652969.1 hypothetical protein FXO37_17231 [Capsicum annuum]